MTWSGTFWNVTEVYSLNVRLDDQAAALSIFEAWRRDCLEKICCLCLIATWTVPLRQSKVLTINKVGKGVTTSAAIL